MVLTCWLEALYWRTPFQATVQSHPNRTTKTALIAGHVAVDTQVA